MMATSPATAKPPRPRLGEIRANSAELRWYYQSSASELGFSSSYRLLDSATPPKVHDALIVEHTGQNMEAAAHAAQLRSDGGLGPEDYRSEAAARHRRIWRGLQDLTGRQRAVLEQFYSVRDWPLALYDRFRERTALVPMSPTARSYYLKVLQERRTSSGGARITEEGILAWLDDLCRHHKATAKKIRVYPQVPHSLKDKIALLDAIDFECRAIQFESHDAYAFSRRVPGRLNGVK